MEQVLQPREKQRVITVSILGERSLVSLGMAGTRCGSSKNLHSNTITAKLWTVDKPEDGPPHATVEQVDEQVRHPARGDRRRSTCLP